MTIYNDIQLNLPLRRSQLNLLLCGERKSVDMGETMSADIPSVKDCADMT